ncbi:phosphoribosylanthranilate isomerase [Pontibacillus litoralis]|uniref:N-(5'-phosphoribosyl)anthranilate isomerase n=1 Tax=Pontibacillus litoralis JSM 072002 TaxID=1385512 RepID=A0A0A5G4U8_9BACI|nr:phosphoribosylanthranilate isomerase [Pontibacillus litoralis]KGX88146.1 N-(5'-phosphoribosyl)anthranilate isomerase [Pontibacillus litoralis JSM 072002]
MQVPKVKVCGNRSLHDVRLTSQSDASYIGFVFAPSKRNVSSEQVAQWLQHIPLLADQRVVGVFVHPTIEQLEHVCRTVPLHIIQLHGHETVAEILHVKERLSIPIWKAIHHEEESLTHMRLYEGIVDAYVVDTKEEQSWGGTGQRFDWQAIPFYLEEARRQGVPCFIAGGINADNVAEVKGYQPDGIDVASGTETDGKKDYEKLNKIVGGNNHVCNFS